jgi:hypothetical protein
VGAYGNRGLDGIWIGFGLLGMGINAFDVAAVLV